MKILKNNKSLHILLTTILVFTLIISPGLSLGVGASSDFVKVSRSITPVKSQYDIEETFNLRYDFSGDAMYVDATPKEIVLVLDESGSMAFKVGQEYVDAPVGSRRIDYLKSSAKQFVNVLQGKQGVKIGLVKYDFKADKIADLTSVENQSGANSLKSAIDSLSPDGGTNTGDGYRIAYHMLKNSSNNLAEKSVVIMTDGGSMNASYSGGQYFTGYTGSYTYPLVSDVVADNYAKKIGKMAKQEDFKNYSIAFSTLSNVTERLKKITIASTKGKLNFYKATSASELSQVYEDIAENIYGQMTLPKITIKEVLPVGVRAVGLPTGFSQTYSNGVFTVTGTINNIPVDEVAGSPGMYKMRPFTRVIKLRGFTGGSKDFDGLTSTYKDIDNNDSAVTVENEPQAFIESDLPKISRSLIGSKWYEVPVLDTDVDAILDNEVINENLVAKGEKGYIKYNITKEDKITFSPSEVAAFGTGQVVVDNVEISEKLPAGVKAVNLPAGFTQSYANGVYTVNGTVNDVKLAKLSGFPRTYAMLDKDFQIEVVFENEGDKEFIKENLEVSYQHPYEGDESVKTYKDESIGVFEVDIPTVHIEDGTPITLPDGTEEKTHDIVIDVDFGGSISNPQITQVLVDELPGNVQVVGDKIMIKGLDLGEHNIKVYAEDGTGEDIGFVTVIPVFDFAPENVMGYEGGDAEQKVIIDGLTDLEPDDAIAVVEFDNNVEYCQVDEVNDVDGDEFEIIYTLTVPTDEPEDTSLSIIFRPKDTEVIRIRKFKMLIIDGDKNAQ